MEEHQALLGRTIRPTLFPPTNESRNNQQEIPNAYNEGGGSSSDGSDSWWDSHSSCSSCSGSSESIEEDWEEAVTEEGDLLYVEAAAAEESSKQLDGRENQPEVQGVLPAVNKPFTDKQGKQLKSNLNFK